MSASLFCCVNLSCLFFPYSEYHCCCCRCCCRKHCAPSSLLLIFYIFIHLFIYLFYSNKVCMVLRITLWAEDVSQLQGTITSPVIYGMLFLHDALENSLSNFMQFLQRNMYIFIPNPSVSLCKFDPFLFFSVFSLFYYILHLCLNLYFYFILKTGKKKYTLKIW